MNFIVALYFAILFFILTPGLFFSILKKGSFRLIAFLHSLLFAIIIYFTYDFIESSINKKKEGFVISGSLNGMPNINTGAKGTININGTSVPISLTKDPNNSQGFVLNIDDAALIIIQTSLQNSFQTVLQESIQNTIVPAIESTITSSFQNNTTPAITNSIIPTIQNSVQGSFLPALQSSIIPTIQTTIPASIKTSIDNTLPEINNTIKDSVNNSVGSSFQSWSALQNQGTKTIKSSN